MAYWMRAAVAAATVIFAGLAVQEDAGAAAGAQVLDARPSKSLSPPDVIRLQLAALAHNKMFGGDRGIAVTWRFASPANREVTGPLARFEAMLKTGYGAMLDHRRSRLGEMEISAIQAKQLVLLEAADGTVHAYVWVLGLQENGPYRGCWMTDAVYELGGPGGSEGGQEPQKTFSQR